MRVARTQHPNHIDISLVIFVILILALRASFVLFVVVIFIIALAGIALQSVVVFEFFERKDFRSEAGGLEALLDRLNIR